MKDKYLNKDYEVTKLLVDLVDIFGDNIIFTGGTSLLKRNISTTKISGINFIKFTDFLHNFS